MRTKSSKKPLSGYWAKLTHKSPSNILFWVNHRIGQRFIDPSWLFRLNSDIHAGKKSIWKLPDNNKGHSPNGQEILAILGIHANKHFFFGQQDRDTLFLKYKKRFPESGTELIEEANDLLEGKIHYAGKSFEIGNEPDWYIPHRILFDYLYHNSFEAFHWLRVLGKAYWLTNDPIYSDHAKKWLNLWFDSIPTHFHSDFWKDVNFVGTRALNLYAGLILFSDLWISDRDFVQKLLEQIFLHVTLLERRLEYRGANHLIWQAHDLALMGLALEPVFDCAGVWQSKALEILKMQINRQFFPDGINFELSVGYQVFVTKLIGEVITVFWKAGKSLPPQIVWGFKQSISTIEILTRPDSKLPLYGDSYRSYDPNLESSLDEAIPLLLGMRDRLFPEEMRVPENDSPILPWLMGRSYNWEKGIIAQEKSFLHCAPESGIAVIKEFSNDVNKSSLYACIQAGKSEQGQVHAHADTLSLELVDNHGPILIDPGAYFENSGPFRTYFRSTLAHNTIRVCHEDISQVSDTFYLWPHTRGIVTGCYQNPELVAIEAQHSSYLRLPVRALHKRVVFIFRAKYLVILDELTGNGKFFVERMFHFAPGILSNVQDQWQWRTNERSWNMVNTSTTELNEEVILGREKPPLGWFAEYRGILVESPTLKQTGTVVDILRCMTVIASDFSGRAKATIDVRYPLLGKNQSTLEFSIGRLNILPFEDSCEFTWLIDK